MRTRISAAVAAIFVISMTTGCLLPRTKVVKNPGPDDTGVRYYRPKPYLFVQPAADAGGAFVTITLVQLPDYEEEYSIHVGTGLGANHTNITLTEGWNLTAIDQDLDSNFDENVGAVADLLSAVGGLATPTAGNAPSMVVRASNVPIGYYESIISRDGNGCKRLYGWRYVGFAPYEPCPVESSGVSCHTCLDQQLYALTFREGVMVFEALHEVGRRRAEECFLVPGPEQTAQGTAVDDAVKTTVAKVFQNSFILTLPTKWMTLSWNPNHTSVEITVTASKAELEPFEAAYVARKLEVDGQIIATVGSGVTSIDIKFVPRPEPGEDVATPAPVAQF